MHTVLVVDDEEDLGELVAYHLEKNGFTAVQAQDGLKALELVKRNLPALIVLDLMLPDLDGLEVFRRLKADPATAQVPVVMLTARAEELDRVVGLEMGADDYVTKPFSPRELVLRIRGILRRNGEVREHGSGAIEFGPVRLVPERFEAFIDSTQIVLTSTEYKLLQELVVRRGKVLSRHHLLENVWGYVDNVTDRTVDTHIKRLRQKIGTAGAYIETVRGVGYRFLDQEVLPVPANAAAGTDDEELGDLL